MMYLYAGGSLMYVLRINLLGRINKIWRQDTESDSIPTCFWVSVEDKNKRTRVGDKTLDLRHCIWFDSNLLLSLDGYLDD